MAGESRRRGRIKRGVRGSGGTVAVKQWSRWSGREERNEGQTVEWRKAKNGGVKSESKSVGVEIRLYLYGNCCPYIAIYEGNQETTLQGA